MKKTLTTSQAVDALRRDESAGWSYRGAIALVEYLEQYEQDLGEQVELDVVAIRCDFSEYKSALEAYTDRADGLAELYEAQGVDIPDCNTTTKEERDEEAEELALEWLRERTTVIEFDGGVIIQDY